MNMLEQVGVDLNAAMRAGEKERLGTLRLMRAALLELHKSGSEVSADDELRTIQKQARQRKDAATQYREVGRPDLAEKEESELAIIEGYLPKQLDEEAVRAAVAGIIAETGASGPGDFKTVMPKAMAALRGLADGGRVQAIVKELLAG